MTAPTNQDTPSVMSLEEMMAKLKEWEAWERECADGHSIPKLRQVGLAKADLLRSSLHHLESGKRDVQVDPLKGLLPCPFCGGEPEVQREGTGRCSHIISCTECGCRLETGETEWSRGSSWNRRKALSNPEQEGQQV